MSSSYYFLIGQALHCRSPPRLFHLHPYRPPRPAHPISINGAGLREGAYIQIFKFYRIPAYAASGLVLLDHRGGFGLLVGLVGGAVYLARK